MDVHPIDHLKNDFFRSEFKNEQVLQLVSSQQE